MNGAETRRSYTGRGVAPEGKVLMEGYRQEVMTGFEKDHPLYNPVSFHAEISTFSLVLSLIL
jgi:hypothetical protein